ncbi:pantoate--beta-alanine ligase [Comamonas endophytica]|uniref:Pantothenate synthetase n=1 Tax=Comamonas endophytica TaxID=2949090 RepID=A0ABY6G798_9BURK|nr:MULTISPECIES: pantoate--beta-alanine ligase [unclassified Acidovorax]MCD2511390.1 pantoate--beta-alanine ligase [Acidovorax sp. D4N7]UYG50783.1 pantoate--beta-alanine ligase [Acidovorax sp. 5MLIR]
MQILTSIAALREWLARERSQGHTIGLVPTMGALHSGHMALVESARRHCDRVVMSIFVNPRQFGPNEDFDAYPRDLEGDCALAAAHGVDAVFAPSTEEMYPHAAGPLILAGRQAGILCGASRPGHFDGVLQVVCKLFNLVQPERAFFGKKDAQQVAIIQTFVRDYDLPLEIKVIPVVREPDGLAKSSRNVYLSATERAQAPAIHAALQLCRQRLQAGSAPDAALQAARAHIAQHMPEGRIDYLELLAWPDLLPLGEDDRQCIALAAVHLGRTRLIDNITFER